LMPAARVTHQALCLSIARLGMRPAPRVIHPSGVHQGPVLPVGGLEIGARGAEPVFAVELVLGMEHRFRRALAVMHWFLTGQSVSGVPEHLDRSVADTGVRGDELDTANPVAVLRTGRFGQRGHGDQAGVGSMTTCASHRPATSPGLCARGERRGQRSR
jgi:hypothetical protein